MASGLDKSSNALIRSEILNPLLRPRALQREGKSLLKCIRRALEDEDAVLNIQQVRDLIFFRGQGKTQAAQAVGLAGTTGREGATSVSLLLGLTLGDLKSNRVVFIDGRLDRRSFSLYSEMFGLAKDPLNNANASGLFQCYSTKNQRLSFLTPATGITAIELFSTEEIGLLLAELRKAFDYVILDMPPLLKSSETRMLLPHLDLFFLVCAARKTTFEEVERAKRMAADVGGTIHGVILNRQRVPFWASLAGRDKFF